MKKLIFLEIFIFSLIILLFSALGQASSQAAIQNITPYTFTLTAVTLQAASCLPSCPTLSVLAPRATQEYSFSGSTGSITFDYDINNGTLYIGHITLVAKPGSVNITNGLGASITTGATATQINYVPPTAYWKGTFTTVGNWTKNNWMISPTLPQWGNQNIEIRPSSSSDQTPYGDNYVRIHYPAGSSDYSSAPPVGGAQFYGAMLTSNSPITLSFYVRYPTTFPFVRPNGTTTLGKLPGLYGGTGNTGSKVPTGYDGWTTRFMWCDYVQSTNKKAVGGGELLQFTFGSNTGLTGTINGIFLDCNAWKFLADGKWHNIQQTVYLNTPGSNNGRIDVCYDGKPIFSQTGITYTKTAALQINGILFQSFFGGTGSTYATPISTYADFADFALYQHPSTAPPGVCVTSVNKPP